MSYIEIADRLVGRDRPTLVIAEIGVNHDGSLQRALELVGIAHRCGADAVKLQVFHADALVHASSQFAEYQRGRAQTPAEMLGKYELPADAIRQIVDAVRACGMVPLATPFSIPDVDVIESLDLPAVKIASPDLVNAPLLARAAKANKPLLVSTGAASVEEVRMMCDWMGEWGAPFALLHCVSSYPTPVDQAHLGWIWELGNRFGVPVGYSDHTTEVAAGALAVAAGAVLVEKHLTYDRNADGPDHAASADPAQFSLYVRLVRLAERMRGAGSKHVLPVERDVRQVSRQSLVVARDLPAGHLLTQEDLIVQRPGTGIPAAMMWDMLGRRLARRAEAGSMLQWDMCADAA